MYFLLTDETNLEAGDQKDFFVYGGLFFPADVLAKLTTEIRAIRKDAGYKPGDKLKFDTNFRPEGVPLEAVTEAKKQVVALCLSLNCRFIVYVVLHEIAKTQPKDNRVAFGVNSVLARYHKFLNEQNEYGMFLADVLPISNPFQFLSNIFSSGLTMQGSRQYSLDRLVLCGTSCINASNAASAVDIVLGSFRYCINNPRNIEAASQMMASVVEMMWHEKAADGKYDVHTRGLISRPLYDNIDVPGYKKRYDELVAHINMLLSKADKRKADA
jgi:hypothetical protein